MTEPNVGILEWFRLGEYENVERGVELLRRLGVQRLRTGVSWADWKTAEGTDWYAWLMPRLAAEFEILPCFLYTPPSEGIVEKTSAPPRDPKTYADWLDLFVTEHGRHFEYVELWNEANNISEWDWTLDPEWRTFSAMVGGAAYWMRHLGKKTVLGGMAPVDPNWLQLMSDRGVLSYIDAVGVHGFPGTWETSWTGWHDTIGKVRGVLERNGHRAEVWITETGYSTWKHDDLFQMQTFVDAVDAPADRLYWYGLRDLAAHIPAIDGFHVDERDYHFGIATESGRPKLLFRTWEEGGVERVRQIASLASRPHAEGHEPLAVVTGGAGFIGTNVADRLVREGWRVRVIDNLAREGVLHNVDWQHREHRERISLEIADVRDARAMEHAVQGAQAVFHFAAQVAVTTSLIEPGEDFDVNARGTLNVLEAVRKQPNPPFVLFTSTNKVYGDLGDIRLERAGRRYEPCDPRIRAKGIGEDRPVDFHSPYGCSKGAADQYVLDYGRSYGFDSTVFRMSCIYGPHQFGNEDQGWVAHFLIRALQGKPITLYGDGYQVRDILFVDDLVDAMLMAYKQRDRTRGEAFNLGGGPQNTTSLVELLETISALTSEKVVTRSEDWRTGDQRYYVSDTSKAARVLGWSPKVSVTAGVRHLADWLKESSPLLMGRGTEKGEYGRNISLR